CVLMQVDVDEIYHPETIDKIVSEFSVNDWLGAVQMYCRYFVGKNLVCEGRDCWSNYPYEWLRAWRFEPGMYFETHEPPKMNTILGRTMDRTESEKRGFTFDHLAYVTEKHVAYKEQFYGYDGLLNQWRALQRNKVWPAKLSRFFSF